MIGYIVFEMIANLNCTAEVKASEAALVTAYSPSVPYTFKLVASDGFLLITSLNN